MQVGVITGEVSETMALHDRDNHGIAGEELERRVARSVVVDQGLSDRNGLDSQWIRIKEDRRRGRDGRRSRRLQDPEFIVLGNPTQEL